MFINFWEHNLFYVKLVLVKWVVASSNDFESVLQFMTVKVNEHSAVSNVIWRDMSEQSSVIEIFE